MRVLALMLQVDTGKNRQVHNVRPKIILGILCLFVISELSYFLPHESKRNMVSKKTLFATNNTFSFNVVTIRDIKSSHTVHSQHFFVHC